MDIRAVKFRVGGEWRLGALYSPSLAGRYPAVLAFHGFPGILKNEDMAADLCRRGHVVFQPYFRGCWGSEGRFSVPGMLEDARASLRLLKRYRHVDASRLAVLGYSAGGFAALRLAAEERFKGVVALAPAVPGIASGLPDPGYIVRNSRAMRLEGLPNLMRELQEEAHERPPQTFMTRIAPTPLLLMHGLRDRVILPESTRTLYSLAGEPKELMLLDDEAHEFQNRRSSVVRSVSEWLTDKLSPRLQPSILV